MKDLEAYKYLKLTTLAKILLAAGVVPPSHQSNTLTKEKEEKGH